MQEKNKGCGCFGLILLIFVVAYIFIVGDSDSKDPSGSQALNSGLSSVITDDATEAPIDSFQQTGVETPTSQWEPFTYPLGSVSTLTGIFRLDPIKEELVHLGDELTRDGSSQSSWAGSGTVGSALYQPVTIDRYNGESLVVVGSEWSGRSQNQQDSMTIDFYPAALLGYSNRLLLEDTEIGDIEAISGISVSTVNEDPDALNAALSGTGIKCLHCEVKNENRYDDHYHILADRYEQAMSYGFFEGTQYIDTSVSMIHPYYIYREDTPLTVPVQVTMDGYFIIDISTLSPGYYVIDGLMGNYALTIV